MVWAGWNADHARSCRNILNDNGSSPDVSMPTHFYFAGEYCTGSNVSMISDLAFVLNCCVCIDNDIRSNNRAHIDNGSRKQNRAGFNRDRFGDGCAWMDNRYEFEPLFCYTMVYIGMQSSI